MALVSNELGGTVTVKPLPLLAQFTVRVVSTATESPPPPAAVVTKLVPGKLVNVPVPAPLNVAVPNVLIPSIKVYVSCQLFTKEPPVVASTKSYAKGIVAPLPIVPGMIPLVSINSNAVPPLKYVIPPLVKNFTPWIPFVPYDN